MKTTQNVKRHSRTLSNGTKVNVREHKRKLFYFVAIDLADDSVTVMPSMKCDSFLKFCPKSDDGIVSDMYDGIRAYTNSGRVAVLLELHEVDEMGSVSACQPAYMAEAAAELLASYFRKIGTAEAAALLGDWDRAQSPEAVKRFDAFALKSKLYKK
jgi:hypothetical protein